MGPITGLDDAEKRNVLTYLLTLPRMMNEYGEVGAMNTGR
jgi:hypothetical protein